MHWSYELNFTALDPSLPHSSDSESLESLTYLDSSRKVLFFKELVLLPPGREWFEGLLDPACFFSSIHFNSWRVWWLSQVEFCAGRNLRGRALFLVAGFPKDDFTAAMAMANRRNGELHSGAAAFEEYPAKLWLPGFYRACRSLTSVLGESLESLFGKDEGKAASEILEETQKEVRQSVLNLIAAHKKVFELKSAEEKSSAAAKSTAEAARLAHLRHHKVTCPSCACDASMQGEPVGPGYVSHDDDEIVVRQSISPRSFSCTACGLKAQRLRRA